jgi:hypothetical protein
MGGSSSLAAATQGLGLLQLGLLIGGNPSSESDAYFYLITWAQLPAQLLLSGFVYPTWLSGTANIGARVRWALSAAPVLAVLGVVIASVVFSALSTGPQSFELHVALFAVLGVGLSAGWALALRLSADGNSSWVSSVTLASNLLSCVMLLVTLGAAQSDRLTFMLSAQIVGMLITVVMISARHRDIWRRLTREAVNARVTDSKVDWYLAQSVFGYGGLLVLQTASVALAPAALSILGLIGRFVSGLNTVITSAVVPRLVNSGSSSDRSAILFIRYSCLMSLSVAATACAIGWVSQNSSWLPQAALVCAWFAAAVLNSTFKRLAIRSLEPRVSLVPILCNLATSILVAYFALSGSLSFAILILAYVLMDLLPGIFLAYALRRLHIGLPIALPCLVIASMSAWLIH